MDYRPQTRNGYFTDEVRSALHKAIRRGQEKEAYFWAHELYELGWWRYLVRTLVTISGEDIGMANPQAMNICMNAYQYFSNIAKEKSEKKKHTCKECGHIEESKGFYQPNWDEVGLLISYLCHSPKNRHVDLMVNLIGEKRKKGWLLKVPEEALDAHCQRGRLRLKKEEKDGLREFYENGAQVTNHEFFMKNYEIQIHDELMREIGFTDLVSTLT
jgi:hypothetical protein